MLFRSHCGGVGLLHEFGNHSPGGRHGPGDQLRPLIGCAAREYRGDVLIGRAVFLILLCHIGKGVLFMWDLWDMADMGDMGGMGDMLILAGPGTVLASLCLVSY